MIVFLGTQKEAGFSSIYQRADTQQKYIFNTDLPAIVHFVASFLGSLQRILRHAHSELYLQIQVMLRFW